eukprot:PITA_22748
MEEEMDSLMHNKTWDLVRLPAGKTTLKNKWVYRLKQEDGIKQRYKARLVVKGFAQKKGIDFDEIFSPVVKMTSIRTILSLVAVEDLHLEQLDLKTTFLHGDLEEEIYMQQPQVYEVKGKEKLVCRLKKSLNNMQEIHVLKRKLANSFAMKDLGAAKQILGMRITKDRKNRKLTLSQNEYIQKVLKRFNMHNVKPISTPFSSHFKLSKEMCPKTQEDVDYMSKVPYASVVGSLMYAMVFTRPNIAHAVGVVSRYMNNPEKEHWMAVKWILRYLKGTIDQALCFGGSNISLQGYVDANMAGDRDNRRSTTRYVFTVGGTAVSWVSKIQSVVALSKTEA